MITYRWVFLNGKKGAANISPPHFHRVCKFNGLKSLDKSVQLLSQAGEILLELVGYGDGYVLPTRSNRTVSIAS
jgi:hypothetical protein